ncbi:hypothetical protein SLE2022_296790 [Rubroshorea leprosula]
MNRLVEELSCLDLVVKESLRLHPVAPLLIPHESMEDVTINGYDILKKSWILENIWAIARDPKAWSDKVEEFLLERLMGSNMDFQGRDFQFIPQLNLFWLSLCIALIGNCLMGRCLTSWIWERNLGSQCQEPLPCLLSQSIA